MRAYLRAKHKVGNIKYISGFFTIPPKSLIKNVLEPLALVLTSLVLSYQGPIIVDSDGEKKAQVRMFEKRNVAAGPFSPVQKIMVDLGEQVQYTKEMCNCLC